MSNLYVVTPTGDRMDAFFLCVKYMNRQTVMPYKWIIVDDGKNDTVSTIEETIEVPYELIRLPPMSGHSLCRNLREAFSRIPAGASVCVMEDDDWYPCNYLEEMGSLLELNTYVLLKEFNSYNVPSRQYREITNNDDGTRAAMHGSGFSGDGFNKLVEMLRTTDDWRIDTAFGRSWGGKKEYNENAVPVHITGFGEGRPGTTPSHRITGPASGWVEDNDCSKLYQWIGDDVLNYYDQDSRKIYIFSNVDYDKEKRIIPNRDDLLVFLNTAKSIDYYDEHENKVIYHRSPVDSYGEERLCVKNRYVYDAGMLSIPNGPLNDLRDEYDWDYPIEAGKVKSATTGYMVTKYMHYTYPLREIVLVNFGFSVAKSTYRCPWHNWIFENEILSKYTHVFTADMRDDESPDILKARRLKFASASEHAITAIFTEAGCDQMTRHDYGEVYDRQFAKLRGRDANVVCICRSSVSNIKALVKSLPSARVFGIGNGLSESVDGAVVIDGDAYDSSAWTDIPNDIDLIIDDGTHRRSDILRGIPVFLSHLADGGSIMIEDIPSEEDVTAISAVLKGAECYRTLPTSKFNDDRIVIYTNGISHGKLRERTLFERKLTAIFVKEGSDRTTRHDYGEVYAHVLSRLIELQESRVVRAAEVGGFRGSGVRSLRRVLPDAVIYAVASPGRINKDIAVSVSGDGYAKETWDKVPRDLDLIIEDGSHLLSDISRGIPYFVDHLADNGTLLIEDIKSESDVSAIVSLLPGAVCYRTTPVSEYGDDRIVLYTKGT